MSERLLKIFIMCMSLNPGCQNFHGFVQPILWDLTCPTRAVLGYFMATPCSDGALFLFPVFYLDQTLLNPALLPAFNNN